MYVEKRELGQTPEDWARNLGYGVESMLSYSSDLRFRIRRVSDPLWKILRRYIFAGHSVLDAGCGMGHWVRFLNSRGVQAEGLDFSEEMTSELRHRFPNIPWHHGLIQQMPFENARFDHIISWGVIEHDEAGPEAALREFYRVLKPDGYCFVTTPVDSDAQRMTSSAQYDQSSPNAKFFQYFFTADELAQRVTGAGFDVELARTYSPSYILAFPKLYMALRHRRGLVRKLTETVAQQLVSYNQKWNGLTLVVGRKPR